MSLGLMSAARLLIAVEASAKSPVLSDELSIGWPSMTKSGWPSPSIVLRPRMMIDEPAPGSPACDVTSTPGAFAASAFTMFDSLDFCTSSDFTELIVFPSFSTVVDVPDPVTTTSPNRSGFAASWKSLVMLVPVSEMSDDVFRKPMARTPNATCCPCTRAAGTTSWYRPSSDVWAPRPSVSM
jgi:hypothetical protein